MLNATKHLVQANPSFEVWQEPPLSFPLRVRTAEDFFLAPEALHGHAAAKGEEPRFVETLCEATAAEEPTEEQIQEAIELQLEQDAEELLEEQLSIEVLEVIRQHDTVKVTVSRYGYIEREYYNTNSHEELTRLAHFYPEIVHYEDGRLTIENSPATTTLI